MKLYTLDFGWRGGLAIIAKSPDAALRKIIANYWIEVQKEQKYLPDYDISDLNLEYVKEHPIGTVVYFRGDS